MTKLDEDTDPDIGRVRRIGFWRGDEGRDLAGRPNYGDDRDALVAYLREGIRTACYDGAAECVICGSDVGCDEYTDGVWLWPQGFEHYILAHEIMISADFLEHARARGFSYSSVKPVLFVEWAGNTRRYELHNRIRYGGPGSDVVVHEEASGPWFSLVAEGSGVVIWGSNGLSGHSLEPGVILEHGSLRLRLSKE